MKQSRRHSGERSHKKRGEVEGYDIVREAEALLDGRGEARRRRPRGGRLGFLGGFLIGLAAESVALGAILLLIEVLS